MVTDPISDLIIRLQNASAVRKPTVEISYSKFAENVAQALKKSGYVSAVEKKGQAPVQTLSLELAYLGGEARVHGVERISKPSRRIYQKAEDIRTFRSGFGNGFYSTPKGIMNDREAKKNRVGGEFLFKIW